MIRVTLLSTLGNFVTKILNRLTKRAENYNVYIDAQIKFRENMNTVENILILHGMINHRIIIKISYQRARVFLRYSFEMT